MTIITLAILGFKYETDYQAIQAERYEDIELVCCGTNNQGCNCVEVWIDGQFMFSEYTDTILANTITIKN